MASLLTFFRAGPPPPKVVLLPDGLFFSRSVPVTPGATPAEATSQVELALEAQAPFPLAQLYYGFFWVPGAERALVYASYRRRFTADQTAAWADAELVIPASVALFGGEAKPATTVVLSTPEGLTAIYWEAPLVPSRVAFSALTPEATDEERARARDELLRSFGGSTTIIDLAVPPTAEPARNDGEIGFRSGEYATRVPVSALASLDVRDKGELAARRVARQRDVILWRVLMGCAAALVLLLIGEFALIGGRTWQKVRISELNAQAPTVTKIKEAEELASSVQDLVTKRFLPLEMVTAVIGTNGERKPSDVMVRRIQSTAAPGSRGSYTMILELETNNPAQGPAYRDALQKLEECERVELEAQQSQGNRSLFRMTVTFKPGALKPDPS